MKDSTVTELTLEKLIRSNEEVLINNGVIAKVTFLKLREENDRINKFEVTGTLRTNFGLNLYRFVDAGVTEIGVRSRFDLDEIWKDIAASEERTNAMKTNRIQLVSVTLLDFVTQEKINKTVYPIDADYFLKEGAGITINIIYYRKVGDDVVIRKWKSRNKKEGGGTN